MYAPEFQALSNRQFASAAAAPTGSPVVATPAGIAAPNSLSIAYLFNVSPNGFRSSVIRHWEP